MITLPDGWKEFVQVRDYPETPDYEQKIGMIVFTLHNKAGQIFGYEIPVMVPTYLKRNLSKTDCLQFYEIAYNTLIANISGVAMEQANVWGRSIDEQSVEVQQVQDQDWRPYWDHEYCVQYNEFMEGLKS